MRRETARRPTPPLRRLRVALVALLLTLGGVARDGSKGSGVRPARAGVWQTGRPVAIAARAGRARFTIPTPGPGARTLVVVSSLATAAGPYPIRLAARSVNPEGAATTETEAETETGTEPQRGASPPSPPARPLPPVRAPVGTVPPAHRTFHLMTRDGDVASASNYLAVEGRLRAFGRRVQVYVDARDAGAVGPDVLADLVATFDDQVFPVAARNFGQARDVDGDGRFTVLMSGWLTRLAGGRHAVDGFVRGADLDLTLAAPFSNHCDMMYLSTAMGAGPHLRTVVAHEYTHAVTFSSKALPARTGRTPDAEEEGWLDEALAHLVEDLHGFSRSNLDYRVSAFLSRPERYRLVVPDYYAADLFRSHGNRGGTYLFLRWCADRFGPALVPALIRSDRRGVANLEAATGTAFADLYRAWSVALFLNGFDPSRPPEPGPHSVNVRAPFDGWDLAGPRTFGLTPGGPDAEWSSAGTASRYLIVGPSAGGATEVTVSAPAGACLQVTAVPLPDDLGDPEMRARAVAGPDGVRALRVDLRERNGTPVWVSALAWEPLVPGPDPRSAGFRRAGLDAAGVAAAFGTASLPAHGHLTSRPIPAAGALDDPRASLVLKAVGTDARGRRVSAWAEVVGDD